MGETGSLSRPNGRLGPGRLSSNSVSKDPSNLENNIMIKQKALLRMKDLNPGLLTATGVLLSVAFRIKNKVIDGDDHVFAMS